MQRQVEQILSVYLRELKGQGVNHAATIIIENKTGQVYDSSGVRKNMVPF
ncbi:MAG: hypothetical protein HY730_09460 [Candidatus Tectomicrobia bacterium]|uniref:Uncharacterized protein n=1 Tax=Tectimicrobiota bacterium TaxID=2528274 RepID=A0A933LRQ5_UNCTE|nr:hypothetical protein [Candidatus Tectomicrobia bacterium]